jgi:dTDP-4-amino-4,6-dideoxygalactose transaminase
MIGKEEREAVLRVMDRGILSGYKGNWSENFYGGPEIKALESEWAEYFGVKHAIAVNSATSGLWAACAAIGLSGVQIFYNGQPTISKLPDEVIVSPYSMTCSASVPLHFGAKPVFADIEEMYFCLDPESIEKHITPKTRAIITVDLFGLCCDYDAINEIAERKGAEYGHKIYVIEDAAQAAGAKYKGKYAGTLGDIGVFSLNVHKPIQCGEGGVIVTNDDDLAFKLRLVVNHSEAVINDFWRQMAGPLIGYQTELDKTSAIEDFVRLVGMNLRTTELSAAIAREQLKKLDGIIKKQQEYAKWFPAKVRPECEHAYYRYAFNVYDFLLNKNGDNTLDNFNHKNHYITPLYKMPLFKSLGYEDGLCPVCEQVDENIVLAWLKEVV